jgi:hypothetical protein
MRRAMHLELSLHVNPLNDLEGRNRNGGKTKRVGRPEISWNCNGKVQLQSFLSYLVTAAIGGLHFAKTILTSTAE